ncbi:arginase [Amycolatopsis deserti]|uniref:Arginase n=1 Tax=Amycolatopsis deserti TaxID=185696 RepID=A0ABQ3JB50_9PSEU|nr:arginase family protein [Amycolatopsis deserti]GHF14297.1 arginase [Amycolatopsis deserti]
MLIQAVPQWQGARTPRAGDLPAGCRALSALAAEVLGAPVREVRLEAGETPVVDGVANREALLDNRKRHTEALADGPVLTIGGDCAADLVPVAAARARHGERFGVVWFDAHADLNTPASSPSGAYHGMVLRSLLGGGDPAFAAAPAVEPGRAVLVGTRALDPAERDEIEAGRVRLVSGDPSRIVAEVRDAGIERLYVHVDLDVLDPSAFAGMDYPEPDGLSVSQLVDGLRALAEFEVVGAAITECVSGKRDDLVILEPVLHTIGELLR